MLNGIVLTEISCSEATRRLGEALHAMLSLADHIAAQANSADPEVGNRLCLSAQRICDQVEIVSKALSRMDPRVARILEEVAREKAAEARRDDHRRDLLLVNSPAEPDWNPPY